MTYWYRSGKKNYEKTFRQGQLYGSWIKWYENGNKQYEKYYKKSKIDGLLTYDLDGVSTEWYENGNKKYEGHFKNGKENGLVVKWSDSGEKIYEKKFLAETDPRCLSWIYFSYDLFLGSRSRC